jgi:23S rRNA-/tRNA-specific pseudouridylate synthase
MVVKRANLLYDPGMSEIRQWIVPVEEAGMRLDHFLTAELEGITRSAIQKLIKNGEILVNDAPSSVHRFLKRKIE